MRTLFPSITLACASCALLLTGPAAAQGPEGPPPATKAQARERAEAMFTLMDVNSDGKLSPEDREAGKAGREADQFDRIDTNGDGSIDRAEFGKVREQIGKLRGKRGEGREGKRGMGMRGKGKPDKGMMGGMPGMHRGEMAAMADTNKDGAVSKSEFMAMTDAQFAKADANNDGTVSPEERKAARKAMREQRP